MSKTKFKQVILLVLDLYKGMPCLWDKTDVNYKSRESRNEGNRVLLEVYKECDEHATLKTVTKKIQNLRTNFFKELAKVRKAQSTGETYVPSLWYYDAMKFLADTSDIKTKHDDNVETIELEEPSWTSSDEEKDSGRLSETPSTPPSKRRKLQSLTSKTGFVQMPERMIDISENAKMNDGDFEILGKSIGIQLRDLNKTQLAITQKLISDAIYYAKMDKLSDKSFIALE